MKALAPQPYTARTGGNKQRDPWDLQQHLLQITARPKTSAPDSNMSSKKGSSAAAEMPPKKISPQLKAQGDMILADKDAAPLTIFTAMTHLCRSNNISYVAKVCDGNRILCHPSNRSTLGLNPHDCHRLLARV